MKNEKTSSRVAKTASKVLRDPHASKAEKSIAGSALTQAPDHDRHEKNRHENKHDKW